ncbi:unnamed protein product [Cyprideis torosa]|uniref:Uncharacterized protein n=1 Tax=Cyprideis torosa TaxID=163714 RepID=A0A7R8ZQL5_9CRUS|nr:unnamed protein product [Cyprideis torosa]CAG0901670.1 unnamed protein product [Cyprideis torosa]
MFGYRGPDNDCDFPAGFVRRRYKDLVLAARLGDHSKVDILLNNSWCNPNRTDKFGRSLLFYATENNHHSVVEVLLAHEADPNITNEADGTSPLHHAKSAKTAELLIAKGAEVNAKDKKGRTPLIVATDNDRHSVVDALLAHGADPNVTHKDGRSPLFVAIKKRHHSVVDVLLAHGADGRSPVFVADEKGHHSVVDVLLAHGADERYLLFVAAEKGHHSILDVLLSHGADPNVTDEHGRSPLFVATEKGHHSILDVLRSHGVDPNVTLFVATEKGHHSILDVLLSHGVDPNVTHKDGRSPLFVAIEKGHHSVVDALLAHGADPNVTHKDGRSPLFVAIEKDHHSILDVLLSHGVDPNVTHKDGRSPLHAAMKMNTEAFETAKLLVEKGANVDCIDEAGETPLHLCCKWGHEDLAKLLFSKGASRDIRNKDGQTACEVAIAKGYVYIAAQFPHYFPSVLNSTESRFEQEFEVLSEIGEGGYGKVYKVKKKTDGKEYALKCVTISGDSEKMRRSLREVRAAMQLAGYRLGNLYIVKCYDAWIEVAEDDEKERNDYYSKPSTTSWTEIMERHKRREENRKLQEGGKKSQEGIEKTPEVNPETQRTESQGGHQEKNDHSTRSSTISWGERKKRWKEKQQLQEGGGKSQEGIEKTAEVNPETQRTESQGGQQIKKPDCSVSFAEFEKRREIAEEDEQFQEYGQESQEVRNKKWEGNQGEEHQGAHQLLNQARIKQEVLNQNKQEEEQARSTEPEHLSKTFTLFILMELMDQSLEDFIRKRNEGYGRDSKQLSEDDVRRAKDIFGEIVRAVEFMHENGYIHRDLKPQNILLSEDARTVKLADLGIAVQLQERNVETGTRTARRGTRFYAAPEQYNSLPGFEEPSYYGAEVDVYALGIKKPDCSVSFAEFEKRREIAEENEQFQEEGQESQEVTNKKLEGNRGEEHQGAHQLLNQARIKQEVLNQNKQEEEQARSTEPEHLSKTFTLFILMELMDQSLEDFIRKRNEGYGRDSKQLSEDDLETTRRIFRWIVWAVDFMHDYGYIHRDLKPGNILLSGDASTVKLADLGIAVQLQERNVETGTRTARRGTKIYAAPEQFTSPF